MSKDKLIPEIRFPEFEKHGNWALRELEQFVDYLQPTPYLVESAEYQDGYEIPVLTAGKSFILGYTNEKVGVFDESLPVIIFDDFTTSVQFVDFPFKVKSSALKILVNKGSADIKFVFESIQNIKYEVGVHQRHWISIFSKIKIPSPSPQEQQKIASCLSTLDEAIAAHSQKLELLKEHKKGLMQNLFPQEGEKVPKLRFKEFEKDGEWVEIPINKLVPKNEKYGIVDGPFGSNLKTIHYKTEGIPIITSGYVTDGVFKAESYLYVTEEKFKEEKRSAVKPGDIVMAKIGARCGSSAIIPKNHRVGILSGNALKITIDESSHSTNFIWQLLWYLHTNNKFDGIKSIGAQPAISMDSLKKFELIIPTRIKEQQKIASCLTSLDALIAAQTEKIEQLKLHKKGLMQGLFPRIND